MLGTYRVTLPSLPPETTTRGWGIQPQLVAVQCLSGSQWMLSGVREHLHHVWHWGWNPSFNTASRWHHWVKGPMEWKGVEPAKLQSGYNSHGNSARQSIMTGSGSQSVWRDGQTGARSTNRTFTTVKISQHHKLSFSYFFDKVDLINKVSYLLIIKTLLPWPH